MNLTLRSLLSSLLLSATCLAETQRPNIVVFISDDLGRLDTSIHGSKDVRTPTMDLLATRGITFDDAVALLPYLDALGIGALYASSLLESGAGSNHGYDVVDPTRVSAERGGEEGRRRLVYCYPWQSADHVDVYSDTDWPGCPRTRKSTSGGCIVLGQHLIKSWS